MAMAGKRVVIVKEGIWGLMGGDDYDSWIESVVNSLNRATKKDAYSGEETKMAESVEVVATLKEAEVLIRESRVDILILKSRSMIQGAREIKAENPRLKVILFTGKVPDEEIIIANKGWIAMLGSSILNTIVFD